MITSILTERQRELWSALGGLLAELLEGLDRLSEEEDRGRVSEGLETLDTLFRLGVAGGPGAAVDDLVAALVPGAVKRLSVDVAPAGEPAGWRAGVDVALFVTSASHPLPPPERPLVVAASDGAAVLFVVVDGVEMLRLAEDVTRMEEAVAMAAEEVLGFRPEAAGVSTGLANGTPAPQESLVPALAGRIVGVLRSPAVVRPKLLAPLEAALGVAEARRAGVEEALASLADDLANLEVVEAELGRFDREAEGALREATAATDGAVTAFGERAGAFVRRRTRPFPVTLGRRRLEERFEAEAAGELSGRLREAARALDDRLVRSAASGRAAVEDRLASFPTAHSRRPPPLEIGEPAARPAGATGAVAALAELRPGPRSEGVLVPLRRSGASALTLLALGLLLVPGGFLWGVTPGGPLPIAGLVWGLGALAVLAAVAVLQLTRRRLTAGLAEDLEELRASAAAALAEGAERAAEEGRSAVLAPVAAYVRAVAGERDRLVEARETLDRLVRGLEGLEGRIETL